MFPTDEQQPATEHGALLPLDIWILWGIITKLLLTQQRCRASRAAASVSRLQ